MESSSLAWGYEALGRKGRQINIMLRKRPLVLVGILLVAISAILYLALQVSAAHEQALSPGEKSLGVAALGMLFGIPMIFCGAVGILLLAFSGLRAVCRRLLSN
jgi:hypothetical protein